ncbi:DsrE/DsrF/TusD sulfur relay family protein [Sulfuricystis multivorans]|uniref:DsrE/DsrF/TusD sulfur relay family protein n=1 Tax=Sulfuricystis multivorans TaxID=2211108 RepID=UPI000F84385F|nr:DsrE family protein [Sulfuricystis multivorans]
MKYLFILNDAPYGTERSYNALRLARNLLKKGVGQVELKVFLLGDAVACAKAGQKVPQGFYNIGDMLGMVCRAGGQIAACGTCMDARGIAAADLIDGVNRGTLDELTEWALWSDKEFVF